jgi:hypothetical protein
MKRHIWLAAGAAASLLSVLFSVIGPAPVAAGGWAITSLDPFDQPVAGQATAVGFTILQHGVTPAEVEGAGIRVSGQGEDGEFFPAGRDDDGRAGHYTAQVVFPQAGTFTWVVEQGWFGPQQLGRITVTSATSSSTAGGSSRTSAVLRYGLPLVAALCLVVIIVPNGLGRRRLAVR